MKRDELAAVLAAHQEWDNDKTKGRRADLHGADLSDADLHEANLRGANLRDADLIDADLSGADLSYADLIDADLRGADVQGADLSNADLRSANLSDTDLRGANLRDTDLSDANLRGANLSYADLRDADLRCLGNKSQIKTLQVNKWNVGYTYNTLQIGCQRHPIEKWMKWDTVAGHKWIDRMDDDALEWANKFLPIILNLITVSPADKP
jgi:hypothetical protein